MPVDHPSHQGRDGTRDQQAEREAADDRGHGPARVARDHWGEHRRQVEGRAPAQDLGDAEGRHDPALRRHGLCEIDTFAGLRAPPSAHHFILPAMLLAAVAQP